MVKETPKPLSKEEFLAELNARCLHVNVCEYTVVWFTLHRTGMVIIDVTIHEKSCDVLVSCTDRPKYTPEDAFEIYLKLLALI